MERARQSTYTLQHPLSRVTWKVNTWIDSEVWLKRPIRGQRGAAAIFLDKLRKPGLELKTLALIPCYASCTSQRNQKSELMERARQSTYTLKQYLLHELLIVKLCAERNLECDESTKPKYILYIEVTKLVQINS